jgi:PAS domain S-box-containing protein
METIRILLAGGSEEDHGSLKQLLEQSTRKKYALVRETDPEAIAKALNGGAYDVYMIGESVGSNPGLEFARKAMEDKSGKYPMLVVSRSWKDSLESAAISAAFADYVALEFMNPTLLDHAISSSMERARTNEILAHERDLLQTLLDNIPDTIYFKDRESRFTRINKAQARVLGVQDTSHAIGKSDFDFFEHAREAYADEQRIVLTGEPLIDKQEKIKNASEEYRWVSTTKVPIKDKSGYITGTVGITRDVTDRHKAEKELEIVKDRLEEAMKNIKDELEMARQIQKSLLPAGFPEIAGVKASAAYVPCSTIGGDFYEMFKLDEHRVGLLMFDVVGHGVPAALIAAMAKMMFGKHIGRGLGPKDLLTTINDELSALFHGKRYLAAFYGVLDTRSREFVYSKGGHPPAMLAHPAERKIEYLSTEGIFIGLFANGKYEEKTVTLRPGDKLVMFTDGLIETFNAKEQYFGLKKFEELLMEVMGIPVDVMVSAVLNAQKGFRENSAHVDDLTLMILQID